MKFLHRINKIYGLMLLLTLALASFFGYFILSYFLLEETKEKLAEREYLVEQQIKNDSIVPNFHPFLEIVKNAREENVEPQYATVYIKNRLENNELEPYLEYSKQIKVNNVFYTLKTRNSLLEGEDLIITISLTILMILILSFGIVYFINERLTKRMWGSFENNLQVLSNYNFRDPKEIDLLNTNIVEFDELNFILKKLTRKLRIDFISAKEFAENASHEMQTPLAITIMNLENVLQEDLPEHISEKIYASYQSAIKLQKLSKDLLLLTKIENRQFDKVEKINLAKIIKEKLVLLDPLIQLKKLEVRLNLNQNFFIKTDPFLADIMISNLLTNAIHHNSEKGFITILSDKNKVSISNSSKGHELKEEVFFERFKKGNLKSESTGLGLAIVKKIMDAIHLNIYIKQDQNMTIVTITQ
jgi:hypothetical protein